MEKRIIETDSRMPEAINKLEDMYFNIWASHQGALRYIPTSILYCTEKFIRKNFKKSLKKARKDFKKILRKEKREQRRLRIYAFFHKKKSPKIVSLLPAVIQSNTIDKQKQKSKVVFVKVDFKAAGKAGHYAENRI